MFMLYLGHLFSISFFRVRDLFIFFTSVTEEEEQVTANKQLRFRYCFRHNRRPSFLTFLTPYELPPVEMNRIIHKDFQSGSDVFGDGWKEQSPQRRQPLTEGLNVHLAGTDWKKQTFNAGEMMSLCSVTMSTKCVLMEVTPTHFVQCFSQSSFPVFCQLCGDKCSECL